MTLDVLRYVQLILHSYFQKAVSSNHSNNQGVRINQYRTSNSNHSNNQEVRINQYRTSNSNHSNNQGVRINQYRTSNSNHSNNMEILLFQMMPLLIPLLTPLKEDPSLHQISIFQRQPSVSMI